MITSFCDRIYERKNKSRGWSKCINYHHNTRAIVNYINEVDIHNTRDANAKADVEKYINLVEDNNLIRNKYNMPLKNP